MPANQPAPYVAHLSRDERLVPLIESLAPPVLKKHKNVCLRLCASIISQQLSTKVAEVIFRRFLELYGGEEPTAKQILESTYEELRGIGLSNAKVNYVQNVARYMLEHEADDKMLEEMSNEEVLNFLTSIKGVGRWTVEMLLMFTLGREDVFAVDDLGIQHAMTKVYELDPGDKKGLKKRMLEISEPWAPYRTYACLYLWKYKDLK